MLEILDETKRCPSIRTLKTTLERYLSKVGIQQSITLIICDDATIQQRNLEHRGEDSPTDVLSYPLVEPDDANMPVIDHLGDVFISLDTAARQADNQGHDVLTELLTLAAHGITHLQGYDHTSEEEWTTFHAAQKRVLELRAKRSAKRA